MIGGRTGVSMDYWIFILIVFQIFHAIATLLLFGMVFKLDSLLAHEKRRFPVCPVCYKAMKKVSGLYDEICWQCCDHRE